MELILYVQVTVRRDKLRINKQLDASNIQNLFCHETLHVSGIFCAHHQELSAVHFAKCTAVTPDDGPSRCPKHVEFHDKKILGYLMHLIGYLYEDYKKNGTNRLT
jgi:hypothetical protein